MKLKLNISPCPNDTFMFDAIINKRIDTEGLDFDIQFLDIECLNQNIINDTTIDISKISYAILPLISSNYTVLDSGSALGFGNGPLLVSREKNLELNNKIKLATPGEHTTANLLINKLFPEIKNKSYELFSTIAESVKRGKYDAGVLIHEGRFTYQNQGLHLISDLGQEWEKQTQLPLPLGAIVVNKNLDVALARKINNILRQSILYAQQNPEASYDFIKSHAQEMDKKVIRDHINMFVNEFSVSLNSKGRKAVQELTSIVDESIFLE